MLEEKIQEPAVNNFTPTTKTRGCAAEFGGNRLRTLDRMEKFVDVRLSAEEAELIDFALDLVVDAYGKNLDQGGIVDQLKEKYRGTEARAFVDQLRRRCYIATDLD